MNHYIISINYKLLIKNYKYFILKKIRLISRNSSAVLSIHLLRLILIAELDENSFVSPVVSFKRVKVTHTRLYMLLLYTII